MTLSAAEREHRWITNSRAVAAFYEAHGRTPHQTATDPTERRLGIWIRDLRVTARGKDAMYSVTPEQLAWMDEHIPGWRGKTTETAWSELFEGAVRHWQDHGALPPIGSPARKSLREIYRGRRYPDRAHQLDEAIPGWREELAAHDRPGARRPKLVAV